MLLRYFFDIVFATYSRLDIFDDDGNVNKVHAFPARKDFLGSGVSNQAAAKLRQEMLTDDMVEQLVAYRHLAI